MGGLGVLFVIWIYFFLATKLIKRAKTALAKVLLLILILIIPTADAVIGRLYLKRLCSIEGGLKVYKVASNVQGFLGYADEKLLKEQGFEFVEQCDNSKPSNCYRLSYENNSLIKEDDIVPKSEYRFRQVRSFEMPNYKKNQYYSRSEERIEKIENDEVLARFVHIAFTGGWAEYILAMFSDAGPGNVAWCSTEPFLTKPYVDPVKLLVTSTLKHSGE